MEFEPRDTTLEESGVSAPIGEAGGCHVGGQYGRYRLERRIGVGGMGEVFAARNVDTGDAVAFKTLSRQQATLHYRFKREFRALADVEHRNLIRLGELVVLDAGPSFFTMELLDGESFSSWVRRPTAVGELPDLDRLQSGLRQLVEGLECLHAHGCVHRDLKPSNIMVTREDRVVILDFGIIAESSESDRGMTRDGQVLGTPIYMAPEQAAGQRAGAPADFYAVGVMLYECLTGKAPVGGLPMMVLLKKLSDTTADPGLELAEIPPQLRELCVDLLHRDPSRRPTGPELLARLGGRSVRPRKVESVFVGREAELAQLRDALAAVREGHEGVTVCVRGRSGHGKSALLREFVGEVQHDELIVLRGRCRERETVPYKGFDAVVDALAVKLRQLDEAERSALRPKYVAALARVFPVLDEIWAADPREQLGPDPHEARSLGWASLRDLLTRLAGRGPLLVLIDDFQWADLDSVAILRAMTRTPEAPGMLLVIAARDDAPADMLGWLGRADRFDDRDVRRLELGALSDVEARELALSLLRAQADPERPTEPGPLRAKAEAIALRCGGSPFFMSQMVLGSGVIGSSEDLDELVARRLAQLEAPARRVLELVAVSGGPLPQSLVLEVGDESDEQQVVGLCELGLLVRSEAGAKQVVEAAHDRIREMCLAGLAEEQRRELHWAIAERLLARSGPEPAGDEVFAIADHFDAGLSGVDSLTAERRLELARLQARAGERALASAAWASARRYLGLGYRLVEPWLAQARRGKGPRELCLALAFGRAQVEAMEKSDVGNAAFDELMGWSLSDAEVGQIVARRVGILRRVGRPSDSIDVGLAGLARLGLQMPRNPSLLRAGVAAMVGWLTLGKRSLESLRALPEIREERVRIRLDVLVDLVRSAAVSSPLLYILANSIAARTIHRYGRHSKIGAVISGLAAALNSLGKAREAGSIYNRAVALTKESRPVDSLRTRTLALLVLPASRPWKELLDDLDTLHRECCDCDMAEAAGYVSVFGASLWLRLEMPHSVWEAMIDRMEARNRGFGSASNQDIVESMRGYVRGFGQTRPHQCSGDVLPRYTELLFRLAAAVESCDPHRANLLLLREISADFERAMLGTSAVPMFAMYRAIVEAQRWPPASGRERRRAMREMRRCGKITRRWATQCPENFGPMADIVTGEIAAIQGHFDQAMAAYERARATAKEKRMLSTTALACMRLARLAHRRGHTIMAESAFESALATYEAWGAKALVARLREIGIDAI